MSCLGVDVGNDTSCVALARKRGIDVLLNKESKRETPAVANFDVKQRFLGTDGLGKMGLAPQNTVNQLKRLLGRKFSDPAVQADIAKLPFSVTEAPDGGCLVNVQFQNEPASFTPQQLMAMILVDLKLIAEAETGIPPVDCVLSVPEYYGEAERYAMLNAAQIAGLNCLRLINETTATALAYGIYKTDLPETDPVHVVFVDVGHSSVQVRCRLLNLRGGKEEAWGRMPVHIHAHLTPLVPITMWHCSFTILHCICMLCHTACMHPCLHPVCVVRSIPELPELPGLADRQTDRLLLHVRHVCTLTLFIFHACEQAHTHTHTRLIHAHPCTGLHTHPPGCSHTLTHAPMHACVHIYTHQ